MLRPICDVIDLIMITSMTALRGRSGVLNGESRSALLAPLRAADRPLSVAEAADRVGLRPSTTRFHLDLLVSAGLVDHAPEHRATAGRPRIRYTPKPAGDESPSAEYEGLADALADGLSGTPDPAAAAREAGRRWTETLGIPADAGLVSPGAAIAAVIGHMDRLGFAPDRPARADRIHLRRCPFEVVARRQRGVVCGVHAGMLEETFRRLGGAVEVTRLHAFAVDEPLLCVAHLREAPRTGHAAREAAGREDNAVERLGLQRSDRVSRGLPDA